MGIKMHSAIRRVRMYSTKKKQNYPENYLEIFRHIVNNRR